MMSANSELKRTANRREGKEADSHVRSDAASRGQRRTLIFATALAVFIVAWAAVSLAGGTSFAVLISGKVQGVQEAASAVARLFAALVLGLFLAGEAQGRMRWVAGGLVVLGLGHLIFGYLEPLVQGDPPELNEALYEGFVTGTFASALFAVGLFPGTPPRILVRAAMIVPAALVAGYVLIFEALEGESWMPPLARLDTPEGTVEFGSPFVWLTPWHWVLSALPLGLAVAAAAGAFWQSRRGLLPGWLLFAMVLLAGSLLHGYLWPSTYGGPVLTTGDMLALAFAVVVAVGGVLELRLIATERAALLAAERENIRRLTELAALRADFTSMVAHEFGNPLAAVGKLIQILRIDDLDPETRSWAADALQKEVDALNALLNDVQAAAVVQGEDFRVRTRPVPLNAILPDAEALSRTLPGDRRLEVVLDPTLEHRERVMADPERIGQVLRNLLDNAAKYSSEGAPIEVRAKRGQGHRVRIEVVDKGTGIHPEDVPLIFEKFGRGRDSESRKVAGVGLGLYLSRRIVQAHGSDLSVDSRPGEGSVFAFELEEVV